jgi:hypothetical protein
MKKSVLLFASILTFVSVTHLHGQNTGSEYKIVNKISLPTDGGWDYLSVDEAGSRLFVSHSAIV